MLKPIVFTCDQIFLMPLAVALRSLTDNNRSHWPIEIHIMNVDIQESDKQKVQDSLAPNSCIINWIDNIDLSEFVQYRRYMHYTLTTLSKLVFDRYLTLEEFTYLDVDILVLGDLGDMPSARSLGAPIAAVSDISMKRRYFNAGVMSIDLIRFNEMDICNKANNHLKTRQRLMYWDQDALNYACNDSWAEIDIKWNWQKHLREDFQETHIGDWPKIIHFITTSKPWHDTKLSKYSKLYNQYRNKTKFVHHSQALTDIV